MAETTKTTREQAGAPAAASERLEPWREANQTEAEYPRDKCIHDLFAAQAQRTPAAPAVVFEEQTLTYRQLDERAQAVAHQLRSQGVGPDVRVGLCLRRSLELVVGLLAIHKAGGAYVPLDPDHPPDRLAFMVQDAGAAVLLTQQSLQDLVPFDRRRAFCLDTPELFAMRPAGTPTGDAGPTAENLAYVIYTSGSTGKPKGVMVRHRNVVNFFCGMDRVLGTQPGVWLAVTSVSFDISVLELFWNQTPTLDGSLTYSSNSASKNGNSDSRS